MIEPSMHVHLGDLEELARKYPLIFQEVAYWRMQAAIDRLEAEIAERTPVGAGGASGLRGSIAGEVMVRGAQVRGHVGTPLAHGEPVELGRKPGRWPPRGPIELWVRRKLGITDPREVAAVTFLVQRKIGKKGFEGAKMFEKGFAAADAYVFGLIRGIPADIVDRVG